MAGLWSDVVERLLKKIGSLVLPATIALSCVASSTCSAAAPPFPACTGSGAVPVLLGEALSFCGFSGLSCCDAAADAALRDHFVALNISDPVCAAAVKAATCAQKCSPWVSAEPSNPNDPTTTMPGSSWVPLHCGSTTASSTSAQQETMCLEMVATSSYLTMVAHPDGSGRVFLATRDGRILLASAPAQGFGAALRLHDDGARPFLDLAGRVHHDADLGLGLMGIAFHPEFATTGRFFVSYTCESASPTCASAAAANTNGSSCPYQLVVAEFCAEGEPGDYSMAIHAYPSEVRRVFAMGLPSSPYHQNGGQILFPPIGADSYYLHLIVGHGGGVRDLSTRSPYYGKIVRLNVDSSSTPNMDQVEVVAMGRLALSNPRGCSFDSQRPSHLYCANVDEVYLISNKAEKHDGSSTGSIIISHGRRPADGLAPSVVGGLVYRGSADPSLVGRYLYMYGSAAWAAMETHGSGGLYSSSPIPDIRCSRRTPLPCPGGGIGGGRVLSWGEDNSKDAFVLATDGVYRVVAPSLCSGGGSPPGAPQPWTSALAWMLFLGGFGLVLAIYQIYRTMFAGGEQPQPCCGAGTVSCHCFNVTSSNSGPANNNPETTTIPSDTTA